MHSTRAPLPAALARLNVANAHWQVWAWECATHRATDDECIWPGERASDQVIGMLQRANSAMGPTPPPTPSSPLPSLPPPLSPPAGPPPVAPPLQLPSRPPSQPPAGPPPFTPPLQSTAGPPYEPPAIPPLLSMGSCSSSFFMASAGGVLLCAFAQMIWRQSCWCRDKPKAAPRRGARRLPTADDHGAPDAESPHVQLEPVRRTDGGAEDKRSKCTATQLMENAADEERGKTRTTHRKSDHKQLSGQGATGESPKADGPLLTYC